MRFVKFKFAPNLIQCTSSDLGAVTTPGNTSPEGLNPLTTESPRHLHSALNVELAAFGSGCDLATKLLSL